MIIFKLDENLYIFNLNSSHQEELKNYKILSWKLKNLLEPLSQTGANGYDLTFQYREHLQGYFHNPIGFG